MNDNDKDIHLHICNHVSSLYLVRKSIKWCGHFIYLTTSMYQFGTGHSFRKSYIFMSMHFIFRVKVVHNLFLKWNEKCYPLKLFSEYLANAFLTFHTCPEKSLGLSNEPINKLCIISRSSWSQLIFKCSIKIETIKELWSTQQKQYTYKLIKKIVITYSHVMQ